ncbi:MAG: BatA domain-containing protein [Planctomycetia bacterium]|nr:BatA domain-containing protein [Planctomycetia bacterium]
MLFLHPFFLGALVCAGIPILLHFLTKPKPKRVVFPALRFLQENRQSRAQSLKIRHILLMLLRVALIVLIVLVFARPQTSGGDAAGENAPTAAIFVFDNLPRMDYMQKNKSRLDEAKDRARGFLRRLPAGSVAAVATPQTTPTAFLPDREEALRQIERLETVPSLKDLTRVCAESLKLFDNCDLPRKEIFIFTDGSEEAWSVDSNALKQALEHHPSTRVTLVDVSATEVANSCLEIPLADNFQVLRGGNVRIQARIFRTGVVSHVQRAALFLVDENGVPQKRGEKEIRDVQNAESVFEFEIGGLSNGTHQGWIELTPSDALECDNRRFFTIYLPPPAPILLVADAPAEKSAFLVKQALAPALLQKENRAKFECDVVSHEEFKRRLENSTESGSLQNYRSIFVLNPKSFSPRQWNTMAQFVHDGGGIGFFLGDAIEKGADFSTLEARLILPATVEFQARWSDGVALAMPRGVTHPIAQTFVDLEVPIPWSAFPIFRAWQTGTLEKGAQTALFFENGTPAVLEKAYGRGKALLMTTPIHVETGGSERQWNLLPLGESWIFVVLMNSIADYLSHGEDVSYNVTNFQTLRLVPPEEAGERFWLAPREIVETNPTAAPNTALSTREGVVSLVADRKARSLDVPALERSGNYVLRSEESDFWRGISVNMPRFCTHIQPLPTEELREVFVPLNVSILKNAQGNLREETRFWSSVDWFAILALLTISLFIVENWLAGRFYKIL